MLVAEAKQAGTSAMALYPKFKVSPGAAGAEDSWHKPVGHTVVIWLLCKTKLFSLVAEKLGKESA
jgi:hypothetical protein